MDEKIAHERTGHATCDPRCGTHLNVRRVSTHPRKDVAEAAYFDYATVKNNLQCAEVKFLVGAGPRGETYARVVHRKRATFEDLELFLKVLQTRHGHIPVYCDHEECLREVVHSIAERLVLPTNVPAIERSQANGRAETRVRALKERLQIMFKDEKNGAVLKSSLIIQLNSSETCRMHS